jgi:Uma2 family endonuclease
MSRAELYLSQHDTGLELSREEFAEAQYQEPWRYERVEGKLVVMNPPGPGHQFTSDPIRDYLGGYRLAHREVVEHVASDGWLRIDENTDRRPDIAVYLVTSLPTASIPERVPELIFEIVSPGTENRRRDYVDKRGEYERIGVQEYVIVDRFDHRVTVLRLAAGRYEESQLGPADVYSTPLLPGLEIPLKEIIGE